MPLLEVQDVHKSFGNRRILNGVSFAVEPGEVFVVMGPSGGGKSTLLKIAMGALKPDQGRVMLAGENLSALDERGLDRARVKFGVLLQNVALLHSLTVGENVALPLREHSALDESVIEIMVRMKLSQVGLSDFENFYPQQLSGGMQKRAGLARAIARDPQLVFYDEPTSGLDPVVARAMVQLIAEFSRALKIAAVVISHSVGLMLPAADRVLLLHEGRIAALDRPERLRAGDDPLVRQFLRGDIEGPIPVIPEPEQLTKTLLGET